VTKANISFQRSDVTLMNLLNDRHITMDIARRRLTLNEFASNVDYLIIAVDAISDHRHDTEELDSRHNISRVRIVGGLGGG